MKNKFNKTICLATMIAGILMPSGKTTSSLETESRIGLHNSPIESQKSLDGVLETPNIDFKGLLKNFPPKLPEEKPDYRTDNFYNDTDEILLARMLLGEAEKCSTIEKIAVAYTAINRANDGKEWNGETLQEAILTPFQYSAFNENINAKLKDPMAYNSQEFQSCLRLAKEILDGKYEDPTNGATHYLNPTHPTLRGKPLPEWTNTLGKIGKIQDSIHEFYRDD